MKISEAFEMYINEFMQLAGRSENYTNHCHQHGESLIAFLGNKNIEEVTLNDLAEWKKWVSIGRSHNTVRTYIGSVRIVFNYARQKGYECLEKESIPMLKREPSVMPFATPEEVAEIISQSDSVRTKFIISFLYASGVRLSEFISLDREQIHDRQFQVIGKGKKKRLCFIDERTERLMEEYLSKRTDCCSALIVTKLGQRSSPSNIQQIVRRAVESAGIKKKITPHSFRHGHATNMIKNGADIRYVAEDLGHANLSTTMIYTHVMNPDLKEKYQMYHTI